ncbi:MAG: hypothetical protein R3C20_03225 [Planctomycetaceae bacterium]
MTNSFAKLLLPISLLLNTARMLSLRQKNNQAQSQTECLSKAEQQNCQSAFLMLESWLQNDQETKRLAVAIKAQLAAGNKSPSASK